MNILLVYPEYPETFWSFKHALKFISKNAALPPLGLLTVSSMLPDDWNKRLVDLNVCSLKDSDVLWADLVFVSAMIVQKASVQKIVDLCNKLGRKVVAGGPAFTTGFEKFYGIDYFVLNEAEVTLPLFLDDLKKGSPKKVYSSDVRPDISNTPIPDWSLINFRNYATMAVQYSRGCPFNCEFCDIIVMNGRIPRTKSCDQMLAEFQSLFDAGWRGSIFIVDDNFIGKKDEVKSMLVKLIEWQKDHGFPFSFLTEASTNLAGDKELMNLMSSANFSKVFVGIETPNVDSLNECGKVQNAGVDLESAVRIIHQNGMQVMGGFIVGFDNDTESIFESQIRFIQKTGVVTAMVGLLNALPQTRLWHRLKAEGRIVDDVVSGENTDGSINFLPKMGKEKLLAGYKKILFSIYSSKNYYKRIGVLIKNYRPTVRNKMSEDDLKAFFRSLWKIGLLSKDRFLYWKLLIRTFFTKFKAFPLAVELSIFGQHFEKITNKLFSVDGS